MSLLADISSGDLILFGFFLLLVLGALSFYFISSFWKTQELRGYSPYTGLPLRRTLEIPYFNQQKIRVYLKELHDFDNRPFDLSKAAFCRETGRIFQDCITWTGNISLDWTFLSKRFSGNFVSFGSLTEEKKKEVLKAHGSLKGFQTEISSSQPAPRMIEEAFAFTKPGPLYIDPMTNVVLGWRLVPGTDFEVLIVKKPETYQMINLKVDAK